MQYYQEYTATGKRRISWLENPAAQRGIAEGFLARSTSPMKMGLYARVSPHDQQTLALQRNALVAYAQQRSGAIVTVTDQYVVYEKVIPVAQHQAISKLARKTNHIERFNNTLRQRVSRLVRDALSFSKKLANHIGAIKLFICHYNLTRVAA